MVLDFLLPQNEVILDQWSYFINRTASYNISSLRKTSLSIGVLAAFSSANEIIRKCMVSFGLFVAVEVCVLLENVVKLSLLE